MYQFVLALLFVILWFVECVSNMFVSFSVRSFSLVIELIINMFKIVEFVNEKDIAIVHKAWMIGEQHVRWPPYKQSTKIYAACKKGQIPEKTWKQYAIRLMKMVRLLLFT